MKSSTSFERNTAGYSDSMKTFGLEANGDELQYQTDASCSDLGRAGVGKSRTRAQMVCIVERRAPNVLLSLFGCGVNVT